jgi:hypothetical protein
MSTRQPDGSTVEVGPSRSPNGHELKAGTVLIGGDVAKRTYLCRVGGLEIARRHDGSGERVARRSAG